jgi:biopolymer transport protein ExbD
MASKKVPEINSSSMADISFLLLIFFLVTTSMATDKGMQRRLPPPITGPRPEMQEVNKRNVMNVLINSKNQLMVQREYTDIESLREKAKEFIQNPHNKADLPELRDTILPRVGNIQYTKNHVISLQVDVETSYWVYIAVQNELVAAYNELRDELSGKTFGKKFDDLNAEEQKIIKVVYDQKISKAEPKNYGGKN